MAAKATAKKKEPEKGKSGGKAAPAKAKKK
jgi:hypothetical protein